MFDCPCGNGKGFGSDHGDVYVQIDPPIDGGAPIDATQHVWKRQGDTFETLTLTPSIQRMDGCRWHGHVTNGEITA